jgi:hypothetical protein
MVANYLHPRTTGHGQSAVRARQFPGRYGAPASVIDWHAAQMAERACCCVAKPTVIAIMPPAAGRRYQVDLLLCGHHYRVSRQALAAAGATVLDIKGVPLAPGVWPDVPVPRPADRCALASARVSPGG